MTDISICDVKKEYALLTCKVIKIIGKKAKVWN